jgi:hypothetical protein
VTIREGRQHVEDALIGAGEPGEEGLKEGRSF